MLEFLKARALDAAVNRRGKRAPGGTARGKAAVTFAARLTFEEVSRRYGDTLALDRVTLDIEPSEILCLLGPSGCGKSTLLRVAAGVERPSSGRILLPPARAPPELLSLPGPPGCAKAPLLGAAGGVAPPPSGPSRRMRPE